MNMTDAPIIYALLTLSIALICGLLPILSKIKDDPNRLKMLTGIAAGIIIASALLVVIPEGYELAAENGHETNDENIAGSIALVMLEVEHGDINETQAIEEIEDLVGGHDAHAEDGHSGDEHAEEGTDEESISQSVLHVIEEVEEGVINASTGLEEIETIITAHSHESSSHEDEHANGLLLGGAILAGFLFMLILEGSGIGHAVHEEHHNHDHDHNHEHVHHSSSGWFLVLGLTLHAATDGLAIGAAAASGSVSITAAIAIAVLIHKGPAAFSLGIFSMHERTERNDSIRDIVIFSLATPVMMMVAFFILEDLETHLIGLAMLFSAGTFLYIATVDTLPDIHNPETGRTAMFYVLIGVVIMILLLLGADAMGVTHNH